MLPSTVLVTVNNNMVYRATRVFSVSWSDHTRSALLTMAKLI